MNGWMNERTDDHQTNFMGEGCNEMRTRDWLGVDDHVMFSFFLCCTLHKMYPPWNTFLLSLNIYIMISYFIVICEFSHWGFNCFYVECQTVIFFSLIARFSGYFPQHPISIIPQLFSLKHTHTQKLCGYTGKCWLTKTNTEWLLHRFSPPS